MNTQNVWIKRSEREPVQEDAPVVYGKYDGPRWIESSAQNVWHMGLNTDYTHWRSIKAEPPPRELTQRERDDAAANAASDEAYRLDADKPEAISINSARRAIYAERREVARLVDAYFGKDWGRGGYALEHTRQIRARLDEQGAK